MLSPRPKLAWIWVGLCAAYEVQAGSGKHCRFDALARAPESAVIYRYFPPGATTANPSVASFWSRNLGVRVQTGAGREPATAHLSPREILTDAIVALTPPLSTVHIHGDLPFAKSGKAFGRTIDSTSESPALVVVTEMFLASQDRNPAVALAKIVDQVGRSTPLLVLRDPDSKRPSFLSAEMPYVLESLPIDPQANKLSTSVTVTMGHPDLIAQVNQGAAFRNRWVPERYQREVVKELDRRSTPNLPVRDVDFSSPLAMGHLPRRLVPTTFMDTLSKLEGFVGRDPDTTFDLGIGQPHIHLAPEIREVSKVGLEGQSPEQVNANLKKQIAAWYEQQYQVKLPDENSLITSGASSAIEQVFASLPEGSTVLIPEYSYAGIAHAAELHRLKVRTYSPREDGFVDSLDPSVSLVVTNFPHNPTGRMMPEGLRRKLQALAEKQTLVLNDLSYTRFGYDGKKVQSLLTGARSPHGLLEVFSGSKDLGLPETRVAAIVGDPKLVEKLRRSDHADEGDVSPRRQHVFTEILRQPRLTLTTNEEMQARRDFLIEGLKKVGFPDSAIVKPEAGLNVMVELPKGVDPEDFTRWLWREAKIFAAPDTWFGNNSNPSRFVRFTMGETSERLAHLGEVLASAGVQYDKMGKSIFLSGARSAAASRSVKWDSTVLGKPVSFASGEQAQAFVEEKLKDPVVQAEMLSAIGSGKGPADPALWDRYFDAYDKLVLYNPGYLRLLEKAEAALKPEGLTVEVGTGTGNFLISSVLAAPGRRGVGTDISAKGLQGGTSKAKLFKGADERMDFIPTDGRSVPRSTRGAANVLVINTFYASEDRAAFLRQVADTVAEDGTVFLHDFFPDKKFSVGSVPEAVVNKRISAAVGTSVANGSTLNQYEALLLAYMNRETIFRNTRQLLSLEEFKVLAGQNGLEIVSVESSGYLDGTAIILRKKKL